MSVKAKKENHAKIGRILTYIVLIFLAIIRQCKYLERTCEQYFYFGYLYIDLYIYWSFNGIWICKI